MSKGLSLLDFVYLNKKTDLASTELKTLIKTYGPLENNIGKHERLMNKVHKMDKSQGSSRWLNKRPFQLLVRKILDIESRIDQYISLMLESEIDLPESVKNYVRIQDVLDYYKDKSNVKENPIDKLKTAKKSGGRPKGSRNKLTNKKYNWVRDRYYTLKKKKTANTIKEHSKLIRSELKTNAPEWWGKDLYTLETIMDIIKKQKWGD